MLSGDQAIEPLAWTARELLLVDSLIADTPLSLPKLSPAGLRFAVPEDVVMDEIDDAVARSTGGGDLLSRSIKPDAIGVIGHSYGGFTALASATGHRGIEADPRVRAAYLGE